MRAYLNNLFFELKKIGRGIQNLRFFKFSHLSQIFRNFTLEEKVVFTALALLVLINLGWLVNNFYTSNTVELPAKGGSYTEGIFGEPRLINPLLAQSQADKDLSRLIFSGLYKYDNQGHIMPDLAEKDLQISDDQKEYTVTLREGVTWHDGKALNADDVLFTIQLIKDPAYQSPLINNWKEIKIEKIDDHTIKLVNDDVNPSFLTNLTVGILPKHIWANVPAENFNESGYNLEAVGSGPYFIKEIKKSGRGKINTITLESYAKYWQGAAQISQIALRFYESNDDLVLAMHTKEVGGFGYIPFNTKIHTRPENIQVIEAPMYRYQAIFFNLTRTNKTLGDRNVRLALEKSLDKYKLINEVYNGLAKPAYSPIMPEHPGYLQGIEQINNYDPNAARDLLEKAGWILDPNTGFRSKDGQELKFTITTNDFVLNSRSAENVSKQWKEIGVNAEIKAVPTTELTKLALQSRDFDTLLFAESTGFDPDPFVFWHSSQVKPPGFNISQYTNTTIDKLISDASNTFDKKIRAEKYAEFQKIIVIDLPAIFLTQTKYIYEMRSPIKGVSINQLANPEDRFYDVTNWYLETRRVWK